MPITDVDILKKKLPSDLVEAVQAAIADDFQPVGRPFVDDGGNWCWGLIKGSFSATFEDLDSRVTALETDVDTAETDIAALEAVDAANDARWAQQANAADGAISVAAGGAETQLLSKTSIGAYTLAAPAAGGIRRRLVATTAFAHVVTATNLIDDGSDAGGIKDTLTFSGGVGAAVILESTPALHWAVLGLEDVTVG
jgi:hypothetical protein